MLVTAGALVAMGASSALASTSSAHNVVDVVGNGSSVHLSHDYVSAGTVVFHVSTTVPSYTGSGSEITMFRPKAGATVAKVFADFAEEFGSDPAKGTRDLTADAQFLGLADVTQGYPMTVTESLKPGTYYLIDAGVAPPTSPAAATKLTVLPAGYGGPAASAPTSSFSVSMTSTDRFVAPRNWPHRGTATVGNVSDTLHFMNLVPVKAGTTDAQVQAYFDSGDPNPPSFAKGGPSGGSDVLSPGRSLQLTYNLPEGTYVLLCFVADDVTGMPHAVMGMHKVVVLH